MSTNFLVGCSHLKTTVHLCWVNFVKHARQQGALNTLNLKLFVGSSKVKVNFTQEQAMKVQRGVQF